MGRFLVPQRLLDAMLRRRLAERRDIFIARRLATLFSPHIVAHARHQAGARLMAGRRLAGHYYFSLRRFAGGAAFLYAY